MNSFWGRMLRVDLTTKVSKVEKLTDNVLKTYLGGKGLGTYLLLQEVKGETDPLSPDNKIIFVTGPATSTGHPATSRYGVFSKSPLTGIYSESYSGGHVAPSMKGSGFDVIIIQGASPEPVFLYISEKDVHFYDASWVWGMDTYETEKRLKEKVGVKGAQALVIGPAGERMVRFACINNNYWRQAGRTGLGAVMGSKKLKGIVFSSNARTRVANEEKFSSHVKKLRERGKGDGGVKSYFTYGTPMLVSVLNEVCAFPTRYWHQGRFNSMEMISAEYMQNNMKVKSRACKGCFIACGKLTEVIKGRHRGMVIEGPEYETIYAFGGLCCIDSLEEIAYLNDLCDRLGMDTISAGNLAALTIEAGLMGKLSGAPSYGDVEGIAQLLKDIAKREGLGAVLAEGIRAAASELRMEDKAIHVKGLEPAGYDPRVLKGMGLAYATSDRGACHLRATFYKPELSGIIDPKQIDGKARLFVDYEDRLAIFDSLILCRFYRDLIGWEELQELIEALTGISFSLEDLHSMANRIITLTRIFNISCGITKNDDTLPPRFFKESLGDNGEHLITPEELEKMVSEYYSLRGWNEEGVPIR